MKLRGVAGLVAAAITLAVPAAVQASVSCSKLEQGPVGPDGDVLEIATTEFEELAAVRRVGAAIEVTDDRTGSPVTCAGGTPTTVNIDTISFLGPGEGSGMAINQSAGAFAPGATDEGDGSSEIEFILSSNGQDAIIGRSVDDTISLGSISGVAAANLNEEFEGANDADVTMPGATSLLVRTGTGNDLVTGRGGATFAEPVHGLFLNLYGGLGNDRLSGSGRPDVLLGFRGKDILRGLGGPDSLDPGGGRDRVLGGKGADEVSARDGRRDVLLCGPKRDRGTADARDLLRGCEAVERAP